MACQIWGAAWRAQKERWSQVRTPGSALAILRQVVASGVNRLVILDGVQEAVALGVLDVADLHRRVSYAADGTEIAMT